jgi:hypothetical protein
MNIDDSPTMDGRPWPVVACKGKSAAKLALWSDVVHSSVNDSVAAVSHSERARSEAYKQKLN